MVNVRLISAPIYTVWEWWQQTPEDISAVDWSPCWSGCCRCAISTPLFYYEQIHFLAAPPRLKGVVARQTQEAIPSISSPFEKQRSGNDKCVRPVEEPSGRQCK